jgi:hypothetical protein
MAGQTWDVGGSGSKSGGCTSTKMPRCSRPISQVLEPSTSRVSVWERQYSPSRPSSFNKGSALLCSAKPDVLERFGAYGAMSTSGRATKALIGVRDEGKHPNKNGCQRPCLPVELAPPGPPGLCF